MDVPEPLEWKKLLTAIWLPLAVGLLIRWLYLYEYSPSVLFLSPSVDALYHLDWAEKIANGVFFPEPGQPFFRAPLYPLFLGMLSWLGLSPLGFANVQVVLSLATIILIAAITFRLHSLLSARIAAWVAALYAPLFTYQIEFQLPVLIVPLFLLLVFQFVEFESTKKYKYLLWSAFLIGLLAITQVNGIVLLPVLFYFIFRNRTQLGLRKSILISTLWLLPILPITLANWIEAKQFVPIATQGGVNFYLGNNPQADGAYAVHPQLGYDWTWDDAKALVDGKTDAEPDRAYYRKGTDTEADRAYYHKGIEFWREHPQDAIKLTLRKLCYLFHRFEIGNNRDLQQFWRERPVARWLLASFAFGLLAPLGIAGAILFWRNREVRIVSITGLLLLFSYVPFFITARYRLPFAALLIVFASMLIAHLYSERNVNRLLHAIALLIGIAFVWHPFGAPAIDPAQYFYTKGNACYRLHRYSDAATYFRLAISKNPLHELSCVNYSSILIANQQYREAETLLNSFVHESILRPNRVFSIRMVDGRIWNNLGVIHQQIGELNTAELDYITAVESYRTDWNGLENLRNLVDVAFQCDTTDWRKYYQAWWFLFSIYRDEYRIQVQQPELFRWIKESHLEVQKRKVELITMARLLYRKGSMSEYEYNEILSFP